MDLFDLDESVTSEMLKKAAMGIVEMYLWERERTCHH